MVHRGAIRTCKVAVNFKFVKVRPLRVIQSIEFTSLAVALD